MYPIGTRVIPIGYKKPDRWGAFVERNLIGNVFVVLRHSQAMRGNMINILWENAAPGIAIGFEDKYLIPVDDPDQEEQFRKEMEEDEGKTNTTTNQ